MKDLIHVEHQRHFVNDESNLLQISVEDTGVGISPQDIKKLFKLFGFLTSTKQINTKGIGLGLYISKMILEQFDGAINLKSRLGVGTKFTFVIATEILKEQDTKVKRIRNPQGKTYPKISLKYNLQIEKDKRSFNLEEEDEE